MTNTLYTHLVATTRDVAPHTVDHRTYGHHQSAVVMWQRGKPFLFNATYQTREIKDTLKLNQRFWAFESREGRDAFAKAYAQHVIAGSIRNTWS